MAPRVSLILPVHDQADHITDVVRGHASILEQLAIPHEIVLVPNGSRDDSNAVCASLAAVLPSVRCIELDGRGWGRAVRSGIAGSRGDLICYANSARTRPDDVKLLVDLALRNPGAVIKAIRTVRHSRLRQVGSWLYNRLCATLFKLPTADVNGTPKVFPRSVASLQSLSREDDLIDLEFMWLCKRDGLTVVEIPIPADDRHGGASTTGWKTAWNLYIGAFFFWRQVRRGDR